MRVAGTILPALVLTGVLAVSALAAGPSVHRTVAGSTRATASLLSPSDLGSGWVAATKAGTSGLQVDCPGWEPSGRGVSITGTASSPDITASTGSYVAIVQLTSTYASAAEARTFWDRAIKPGLVRCVSETLETISTHGFRIKILSEGPLRVAPAGTLTAGYRVVADLTSESTGRTLKTFFDVVFVGRDATLSELTFSSFTDAVPGAVEAALAKLVYRLIGLPLA
jgi:hypothetical protein